MNAKYRDVRFLTSDNERIPARFGIVTAYNPNGVPITEGENRLATKKLQAQLVAENFEFFEVTGCSSDLAHQEPGFGIVCDDPEPVIRLGKAYQQEAVFWVENGRVNLVACEGRELIYIGDWKLLGREQ